MSTINLEPLKKALTALHNSISITEKLILDKKTTEILKNTLMAGVIQHFEFCYDLSWKMLKRMLEQTVINPESISTMSYKALIREGAVKGFIDDVPRWFMYRDKRNLTSHTYDPNTAEEVYKSACEFYSDAIILFNKLKATQND